MTTIARLTLGALAATLLGTAPAGAADGPGVKETIKREAVELGREVKKDARVVGTTVKQKSKEVAHTIATESRAAGQAIKQGTRQKITDGKSGTAK